MAINYANKSKQELVLLQMVIEKLYDDVDWSFINQLMSRMGFGDRMSKLIYTFLFDTRCLIKWSNTTNFYSKIN